MKHVYILLVALVCGCSSTGGNKPVNELETTIRSRESQATDRMADDMGIPREVARAVVCRGVKQCPETGRDKSYGSWTDDARCSETPDPVHAWNITNYDPVRRRGVADYMFAVPDVKMGCVDHETMHKLLRVYGVGGHPKSVTVNRLTDGKRVTLDIPAIVKWRWPSLVLWDTAGTDTNHPWGDGIKCGTGETFTDGAGI